MRCEWFVMFLFRLVTDGRDLWECILGLHWLASGMTGHIPNGQSSLPYKAIDNPCQKELDALCTDICRFIVWWVSAHLPFFVGTNFSIPVFCVLTWRFWNFLVVVSYCSSVPNKARVGHYSSFKSWPSYVVDGQGGMLSYHSGVLGNPKVHQGGPMALGGLNPNVIQEWSLKYDHTMRCCQVSHLILSWTVSAGLQLSQVSVTYAYLKGITNS